MLCQSAGPKSVHDRQELGFKNRPRMTGEVWPDDGPIATFRPVWEPMPLRAIIESQIERLIAFLDRVDGDPDIEANGDEGDYSDCD